MYYVYILHSQKDKKLYLGMTSNLKRRMDEHKQGRVKSTKNRLPLELVCYEAYTYKKEAENREKYLKSSDGRKGIYRRLTISLERCQSG